MDLRKTDPKDLAALLRKTMRALFHSVILATFSLNRKMDTVMDKDPTQAALLLYRLNQLGVTALQYWDRLEMLEERLKRNKEREIKEQNINK
jgi:hypothetical protein